MSDDENFATEYWWVILLLFLCVPSIITGIVCWVYDCMERNKPQEQPKPNNDIEIKDNDDNLGLQV